MEHRKFHPTRPTALWPFIDLLECPRRALPALDRLITPDPYPDLFYIQHSRPISAHHVEQSVISDAGGETRFPGFSDSPPGESIPRVKQSVKHRPVHQPAITPPPWENETPWSIISGETKSFQWGRDRQGSLRKLMFIQLMPRLLILTFYHWLQTKALHLSPYCFSHTHLSQWTATARTFLLPET